MTEEMILANATLVLADETITGSVRIVGESIAEIATGRTVPPGAIDCEGDYVSPGLVELTEWNVTQWRLSEGQPLPRPP